MERMQIPFFRILWGRYGGGWGRAFRRKSSRRGASSAELDQKTLFFGKWSGTPTMASAERNAAADLQAFGQTAAAVLVFVEEFT